MDSKYELSGELRFLHDIATPISILRLHSKRLLKMCLEREGSQLEQKLLEQIMTTIQSMETIHSNRKVELYEKKIV